MLSKLQWATALFTNWSSWNPHNYSGKYESEWFAVSRLPWVTDRSLRATQFLTMLFTFATKIQCNRNSELLIYTLVLHHWVSRNRWLGKSIHGLCVISVLYVAIPERNVPFITSFFVSDYLVEKLILWNLPSSQTALNNGNQSKTGGKVLMHCFISSNCRSLPSHGIQISVIFKAWQNTTLITQRMEPIGEYINIMGRTR